MFLLYLICSRCRRSAPGPEIIPAEKPQQNADGLQATQKKQPRPSRMVLKNAMRVFSREAKDKPADGGEVGASRGGRSKHRFDFDLHFGPGTGSSSTSQMAKSASLSILPTNHSNLCVGQGKNSNIPKPHSQSNSPLENNSTTMGSNRKEKRRPKPLDLQDAVQYGELASRAKHIEAVHDPIFSSKAQHRTINDDGSSSVYVVKSPFSPNASITPLHIIKQRPAVDKINRIFKTSQSAPYIKQEPVDDIHSVTPWPSPTEPEPIAPLPSGPLLPSSVYDPDSVQKALLPSPEITESDVVPAVVAAANEQQQSSFPPAVGFVKSATTNDIVLPTTGVPPTTPFTPLSAWMVDVDGYTRKVSKNLFGDHGWLQDTAAASKKPEAPKPAGLIQGFRTFARGIVSLIHSLRHAVTPFPWCVFQD
jgi:hypothetical protein